MSESCIETPEAPAWLSKLESQREKLSKAKLGHDSGAGAACNACGPGCPGLDLHFWRKVCRACHCTKDVHDVQDDDMSGWAHFQLLGTAKPKKPNFTMIKIRGLSDAPVKLDWIPPNTSLDVVSDYMSSLGGGLAPVVGSDGAAKRREQLRRQVPLHDISSELCCHKLSSQEQQEHQDYISHIKNQVVGMGNIVRVGTIQKGNVLSINTEVSQPVPGTKSYSLPLKVSNLGKGLKFTSIPKNTTDKHLVLDNMGNIITKSAHIPSYQSSPIISKIVKDKLNYMRIESDRIKSAVEHGPIYDRLFKDLKQLNVPLENDVYLNPIKNFRNEYNINPKFKDETTAFVEAQGVKIIMPSSLSKNHLMSNNYPQNGTIFGPKGEIWSWATQAEDVNNPVGNAYISDANPKYYTSCEDVPAINQSYSQPLGRRYEGELDDSDIPPPPNYDTYPGEVKPFHQSNYPANNHVYPPGTIYPDSDSNNYHGNSNFGNYQDGNMQPNNANNVRGHPGNADNSYLEHYPISGNVPQAYVGEGSVLPDHFIERVGEMQIRHDDDARYSIPCKRCKKPIEQGQVAVKAERAGENASWHPQCFACAKCNELLADLVYFFYQGDVYCARDLAEALKIPRCAGCDELIFSRSYTAAEGNFYHSKHFCCYHCDIPLGGKQYIPDDKTGQPICLDCNIKFYAKKCHTCKNIIEPEQQGVSWKDYHWHGTCFNCSSVFCGKSLLSGKFIIKNEKAFCSSACVQKSLQ